MGQLFFGFLDDMWSGCDASHRNLIEAIRDGYDTLFEGRKFTLSDGSTFIMDPNWSTEEDEMVMRGEIPPGRTQQAAKKRMQRIRAAGIKNGTIAPKENPQLRTFTKDELIAFANDPSRTPPDWVLERCGSWSAAKKYCDSALYRFKRATREKNEKLGTAQTEIPSRRNSWTKDELAYLFANKTLPPSRAHVDRSTKNVVLRRMNNIIEANPKLKYATPDELADAYVAHVQKSQAPTSSFNKQWGDIVIPESGLIIPSSDSTLAMEGEVPDGKSVSSTQQRRSVAIVRAAINYIRQEHNDSSYTPTRTELQTYIAEHPMLISEYHNRRYPTSFDINHILSGNNDKPFGMSADMVANIKNQLNQQANINSYDNTMRAVNGGKRARKYDLAETAED